MRTFTVRLVLALGVMFAHSGSVRADLMADNLLADETEFREFTAKGPQTLGLREPFPLQKGSLSMWVKPVDWSSESPEHIILASAQTPSLRFQVYKFLNDPNNTGLCFLLGKYIDGLEGFSIIHNSALETDLRQDEWRHLAVAWSLEDGTLELYLDGWMVASGAISPEVFPEEGPMKMTFGSSIRSAGGEHYTTEFRTPILLDRRLTDQELTELVKSRPQ